MVSWFGMPRLLLPTPTCLLWVLSMLGSTTAAAHPLTLLAYPISLRAQETP